MGAVAQKMLARHLRRKVVASGDISQHASKRHFQSIICTMAGANSFCDRQPQFGNFVTAHIDCTQRLFLNCSTAVKNATTEDKTAYSKNGM